MRCRSLVALAFTLALALCGAASAFAGFDVDVVGITCPSKMEPGKRYKVTVRYKNVGELSFGGTDYKVIFEVERSPAGAKAQRDDFRFEVPVGGQQPLNLVAAGATADETAEVLAPDWEGEWVMVAYLTKDRKRFGSDLKKTISVSGRYVGQIERLTVEEKFTPGRSYPLNVRVKNTGATKWLKGAALLKTEIKAQVQGSIMSEGKKALVFDEPVAEEVPPGGVYEFKRRITAPKSPGKWQVEFQLFDRDDGKPFGKTILQWIEVG